MRHIFILGSLCLLCFFIAVSHGLFLLGCDDDDDDSTPSPTATTTENTPTPTPTHTPIETPTATATPGESTASVQIWTKPVDVTGNEMLLTNTQTMEEWRFINAFEASLAEGSYTLEAFPCEYWLPENPSQDLYFQAGEYYGIEVVYYCNAQEGNLVGDRAFNFTLNDRYETSHSLYSYWGQVILLDLSAMWCGPCKTEASKSEALYQQYKNQGFIILSVLIEDATGNQANAADCATWANTYGITFPVLYDQDFTVWNLFNTEGYIPLNLVIDRNMIIRYKKAGYNEGEIRAMIESLL